MSVNETGAVDAVLLAGGAKRDSLLAATGARSKALVSLPDGRTLLETVLTVLRQCPSIHRVVVVGDVALETVASALDSEFVHENKRLVGNLIQGFTALGWPARCLVATCDIPLITAEAIEAFIASSRDMATDIVYPIVPRDLNEEKFPGAHRTYVSLKDGTFTGGNALLLNGDFVRSQRDLIQRVFDARKSPLKLCRLLGLGFILRFLTKQLTVREIEERVGSLFHCSARAVVFPYPGIGFDVDKPEDLAIVAKILNKES